MNALTQFRFEIPDTLNADEEFEVKTCIQHALHDAVNSQVPLKIHLHRYMKNAEHSDQDDFCECGIVELIIPYDHHAEVDEIYREYLRLSKSFH